MAEPRPKHLSAEYAAVFQDQSVVDAYHLRPPYPPEVFRILRDLIVDEPSTVLDLGCGRGEIARELAQHVERVDAVDVSAAMIARGKTLPGGARANLHWLLGRSEDVELDPPYALITAGQSLHWMEWDVLMPRLRRALAPGGSLAIIGQVKSDEPWDAELQPIVQRYSMNVDFQPFDLITELQRRGLFAQRGERRTQPLRIEQSLDDYIETIHASNGFSRDRMDPESAAAYDAEARALVSRYCGDRVTFELVWPVTWGIPLG